MRIRIESLAALCAVVAAIPSASRTNAGEGERPEVRARMVLADRSLPPLHLKRLTVTARIEGRVAHVAAESVYRNDTPGDLEAT